MISNLKYYYNNNKYKNVYIGYSKFIQNKQYNIENIYNVYDLSQKKNNVIAMCSSGILRKTTPAIVKRGIKDKGYHVFDEKIILLEIDDNDNSSIIGLIENNIINRKFLKNNNINIDNYNLQENNDDEFIEFQQNNDEEYDESEKYDEENLQREEYDDKLIINNSLHMKNNNNNKNIKFRKNNNKKNLTNNNSVNCDYEKYIDDITTN